MRVKGSSRAVAVVVTAGVMVLAACSSSSKASSSASGSPAASPTTASTSGPPIKVLAVTQPLTATDATNGLKMAEAYINANGGVKGRPLSIILCSDNNDPNTAATCVRDGISQGAVAEIDRMSAYGATMDPLEQAAGMVTLGGGMFSQADFAASNMFPLNAGLFNSIGSAPLAVKLLGAKTLGAPHLNTPAAAALPALLKTVCATIGCSVVGSVAIATTAADITPQVAAEVQAKPDVVINGLTVDAYVKLIKGMQQQGSSAKFEVSSGIMDASRVSQYLGASVQNIYVTSQDDYQSAGYQQFLAACKQFCPDPSNLTGHVIWAWEAALLFKTVAESATSIDAKGIAAAAAQVTNFTIGNIIPPVNFSTPSTAFGGKAPRLFNDTMWIYEFKDGQLLPLGGGTGVKTLG